VPVSAPFVLLWPLLAPSGPAPTEPAQDPAPTEAATPVADEYAEQAPLDVETLLTDSSRAYLDARARLEAHPTLAAEAILDRLTTVPPPTSTDRKRLFDVLAVLGLADHIELFARELRRSIVRADSFAEQSKALKLWLPLLADQGAAALPSLTVLIADQELPLTIRATLLDTRVEVTPAAQVSELVSLVGRGARPLRRQLQRSLSRRASQDIDAHGPLLEACDRALEDPDPARMPALLQLRGSLTRDGDDAFILRLAGLAENEETPFSVRVSALRALGGRGSPLARDALVRVAEHALAPALRATQRGELLAWLALKGLPESSVRPLVERHDLASSDAPRLTVLGLSVATLSADHRWLKVALDNPWPQVRQAALSRVEGPCESSTTKLLGQKAHLAGRRAEEDRAVARSAVAAMGRCQAGDRLRTLLRDEDLDVELRAEAARQLARLGDDASIDAIASVLLRNPDPGLARRLASALRHMPKATPKGDDLLCEVALRTDQAGHAARDALGALHDDPIGACEQHSG